MLAIADTPPEDDARAGARRLCALAALLLHAAPARARIVLKEAVGLVRLCEAESAPRVS